MELFEKDHIYCSIETITDIKFHFKMVAYYMYAQKRGVECTAEIKKHMNGIVASMARSGIVVELTGDIAADECILKTCISHVKSAAPSEKHICEGVANA